MDYFGINSPNELPQINEVLMEELVKATVMNASISNNEETQITSEATEIATTEVTIVDEVTDNQSQEEA